MELSAEGEETQSENVRLTLLMMKQMPELAEGGPSLICDHPFLFIVRARPFVPPILYCAMQGAPDEGEVEDVEGARWGEVILLMGRVSSPAPAVQSK